MNLELRARPKVCVPMAVTARLSEPFIYRGRGMHLDGILAAAAFADMDERTRRRIPPLSSPWVVDIDVPLAKWIVFVGEEWEGDERLLYRPKGRRGKGSRERGVWGFCASDFASPVGLHGKIEIRKRPPMHETVRWSDDESYNVSAGPMKAYDIPIPTYFAHEVTWHALGDPGEVLRLLRSHVTAIGGKRNIGMGAVASWDVEQKDDDFSILKDGRLRRRLPIQSGVDGSPSTGAIRPPYHHRSRVMTTVEPDRDADSQ